jgi:hypothetical protein
MNYPNTPQLRQFLIDDGLLILAEKPEFLLDEAQFRKHRAELLHQGLPGIELDDHAAFLCLTFEQSLPAKPAELKPQQILVQQDQLLKAFTAETEKHRQAEQQRETQAQHRQQALTAQIEKVQQTTEALRPLIHLRVEQLASEIHTFGVVECERHHAVLAAIDDAARTERRSRWFFLALLLALIFLILARTGHAQNVDPAIVVVANCNTTPSPYPATGKRAPLVVDATGKVCTTSVANTDGSFLSPQFTVVGGLTPGGVSDLPFNSDSNGNLLVASVTAGLTTLIAPTALAAQAVSGCYLQSAASTNATSCRNLAANFYGVRAVNTTATLYYLRLYNLSAAPTCSSATGFIESIPIPASTTGAGIQAVVPWPINYPTGLAFCLTGGGSSTDNTNAATGVYIAIYFK